MGLFDTVEFDKPIKCKVCGKEHTDVQTKQFENLMISYSVGDLLPCHIITGVLEEYFYCSHDDEEKDLSKQKVYFVIWHNILVDVTETYGSAEKRLKSFGKGDLYLMYRDLCKKYKKYRYKFNAIKVWTRQYIEYSHLSEKERADLAESDSVNLSDVHIKYFAEELAKVNDTIEAFEKYLEDLDKQKNYYGTLIL
jgi:hypothetical protein